MFSNSMEKQLEEMDQEEEHDVMLNYNKTYPYGLFNLVSSSLFYKMPLEKKLKAIQHALQGDAAPQTIFYNTIQDIVYFINNRGIFHRCDLRQQQFIVNPLLA